MSSQAFDVFSEITIRLFLCLLFNELSSMKFAGLALVVANVASVSVTSDEKAKALSLWKDVSHDATLGDLGKTLNATCHNGDWQNLCDRPIAELFRAAEDSQMTAFCDSHCPLSRRAEHRALLARGQPHQSFLQNDLEALASHTSDCWGAGCKR